MFGLINGVIFDCYFILLVVVGYVFVIWGLIFLWDVVFGLW